MSTSGSGSFFFSCTATLGISSSTWGGDSGTGSYDSGTSAAVFSEFNLSWLVSVSTLAS